MSAIDSPFDWGAAAILAGEPQAPARPTDAQIASGYPDGQPVPAEELNWVIYMIGRGFMPRFETLEDAVAGMTDASGNPIEACCIVDEHDMDQAPGSVHTSTDTAANVDSIAVTAKSVIIMHSGAGGAITARSRDFSTLIATYAKSAAGANVRVASDGRYVAVAYGQYVELFDHDTGVSQWVYDNGAFVWDVCLDGSRVYLVGAAALAQCRAITIATGLVAWAYNHFSVALFSVATNGRQVFVSGLASGHASGATMRAIVASSGADALNEGGLGVDASGASWDLTPAAASAGQLLATDGRRLYCFNDAAAADLTVRGCADGQIQVSRNITGIATARSVSVDHELVTVAWIDGAGLDIVTAFRKGDLSAAWNWQPAAGAINTVETDGVSVFAGFDTGGGSSLVRLYRGNRPGVWRRIDPADSFLPMRQLLIPSE